MERLKPSQAMALGALLLALGVAWEVRAGRQARAEFEARSSGEWKLWIEVAKEARAHSGGPELECTELGGQDGAALRFLLDAQGPARGSSAVALVGADYAFAASKLGTLKVFDSGDGAQPCALLYPHPQGAARLREVDSLLKPLFSRLGPLGPLRRRQEALAWLDAHPRADPWARNAAWELVLFNSVILHDIPRQRMLQALSEPLLSARIPMELAEKLSDAAPREAGALRRLAGRIDPTRLKARADQVR
jgi:hypothetical protein